MRLFVGGLPFSATDDTLREFFTTNNVQVTDASVKTDRDTGKSRGFGFVTVETKLDLDEVIGLFHNTKMDGRNITVNEAQPKPERGGYGGGGREHGGHGDRVDRNRSQRGH